MLGVLVTVNIRISAGHTVNREIYVEIFHRLKYAVTRKRPEKRARNSRFLLYDNALSHLSLAAEKYLAQRNMMDLEHLLYYLYLSPPNFFLFPLQKKVI
jgi:hypothetical protein